MRRSVEPISTIRPPRRRSAWQLLAWAFVAVLIVAGLATVAVLALFVSALNSFGTNK
jgi:hypothetical protein